MPSSTSRSRREFSISSSSQIALLPTLSINCGSGRSTPSCYSLPSYHSSPGSPSPESESDSDDLLATVLGVPTAISLPRPLPSEFDDTDLALTLQDPYDSFFTRGFNDRHSINIYRKESGYDPSGEDTSSGSECDFDSDLDEDIRSGGPSFCATATKVKITPLRAVRRTIRRSVIFDYQPRKSSAEEGMFNPYWRAFKTVFNDPSCHNAPASAPPPSEISHDQQPGSWEKVTPVSEPAALPQPVFEHPVPVRKMSMENLKKFVPFRKPTDHLAVDPLERPPLTIKRSSSLPMSNLGTANDGEIDIMEFHDVTQEAAQIAAMLNFKWRFETAADQVQCGPMDVSPRAQKLGVQWSRRLAD